MGFPGSSDVKQSACNAGIPGLIPGSGRSPGEGNGNPLQYPYLENPMDRGVWQAIQSMVLQRAGHDSHFHFHISDIVAENYRKVYPWRREWLSTPVFLPGEFHGHRSLANYSLWGCK